MDFTIVDEVTGEIVSAGGVEITAADMASLEAFEAFLARLSD